MNTQIENVVGHLGAALRQQAASDDKIIMGHVWDAYEAAKKVNDLDRNYRNAILESAALVAEQIDNCRGSTYDNGCTDDGYRQAKNHIAVAIRALKALDTR